MSVIAPRTSVSERPHRITMQNPGPAVPDGDGGYTQTWVDLNPLGVSAKITPATEAGLERVTSGTALSTASHVVIIPHHPGVTTKTRVTFGARTFYVVGVSNPEERNIETIIVASEVVA